jgi:uncharacterized membrane protein SpoIIM required for sporulation
MRESKFIEQNKKKWEELEHMLSTQDKDPNKLSDLFVQITDDLSFARTYYPSRSVRYYLNNLAQQIFHNINKGKKNGLKNFKEFWVIQIPKVIYDSRKELLLSFIVFTLAIVIGIFSSLTDKEFAKSFLGEEYIRMTMENIKSGDPMAVYKSSGEFTMFFQITVNNIQVAFWTFVTGILFSVGTLITLFYNGIMVGTFQYFFIEKGLFWDSFLTIWVHGTLEISSVIIAGGAGLKLGSGLIFPGTYTRLQAFILSGKKALMLMISTVPLFILAGFIESFLTRYTDLHYSIKASFILISLVYIAGFYIINPLYQAKKGLFNNIEDEKPSVTHTAIVNFNTINTTAEIFSHNFVLYKNYFNRIFLFVLPLSILFTIPAVFYLNKKIPEYAGIADYFFITRLFSYQEIYGAAFAVLNFIAIAVNLAFIFYSFIKKYKPGEQRKRLPGILLQSAMVSASLQLMLFAHPLIFILLFIFLFPFVIIWSIVLQLEEAGPFTAISRTINLVKESYPRILAVTAVITISAVIYFLLLGSPFTYLYFEAIQWNLLLEPGETRFLMIIFSCFISTFVLQLIIPLFTFAFILSYFTLKEIRDAQFLKERISNFGVIFRNGYR